MVRIGVSTALVVGKVIGGKRVAKTIGEAEAALHSVCARQPAKKVVERAILHCDQHNVINAGFVWPWQRGGLRENRSHRAQQECTATGCTRRLQEFPATDENVSLLGTMLTFIDRSMADVPIRGHLGLRGQESSRDEMRGRIAGLGLF